MRARSGAVAIGFTIFVACGRTFTSDPADAGVSSVEDGGASSSGGEDASSVVVLHVSQLTGSDEFDGRSSAQAKRTITNAIATARAAALVSAEIHACKGTYRETGLTLDYPVSLRGGYDCTTWRRPSDFGKAGNFGASQETTLEPSGDLAKPVTLSVSGLLTRATLIDGVSVSALATGTVSGAAAVSIVDASPTLSDNAILGGGTTSTTGAGTTGLVVLRGGPEVRDSVIKGGSGIGVGIGSLGLSLRNTTAHVHGCRIGGGTGSADTAFASIGVAIAESSTLTGENAFEGNDVSTGPSQTKGNATAIDVNLSDVDLVRNIIVGGRVIPPGTVTSAGSFGVRANGGGGRTLRVRENRIYGGSVDGAANTTPYARGLDVANFGALEMVNNAVHGGTTVAATSGDTLALAVTRIGNATVTNNTLFSGVSPRLTTNVFIYDSAGSTTTGLYHFRNNLMLGSGAADRAVVVYGCTILKTFQNNGLYAFSSFGDTTCNSVTFPSLASLETYVTTTSGGVVGANVAPGTLASSVVQGFSAGSAATALITTGFPLVFDGTCAVARGGQNALAVAPKDILGIARALPLSIGAWEENRCIGFDTGP